MTDMFHQLIHYLNYHSIWIIFGGGAIIIVIWCLSEFFLYRKENLYRIVNLVLFVVYVCIVLTCTVLFRKQGYNSVSLIPFTTLSRAFSNIIVFKSVLLNILLFMPLTMFGCSGFDCIRKKRAWAIIAFGFGLSIMIETIQYVFSIGQTDIDDVIFNTLGLIAGYLIYRFHYQILLKRIQSRK